MINLINTARSFAKKPFSSHGSITWCTSVGHKIRIYITYTERKSLCIDDGFPMGYEDFPSVYVWMYIILQLKCPLRTKYGSPDWFRPSQRTRQRRLSDWTQHRTYLIYITLYTEYTILPNPSIKNLHVKLYLPTLFDHIPVKVPLKLVLYISRHTKTPNKNGEVYIVQK